jgi:predicted MFS family arabinose efflux permease
MLVRRALLAAASGLALADAAIVTLALPELLVELSTTVEGVAAVIAVYTATLALSPVAFAALGRRTGAERLACGGFLVFCLASIACALADDLTTLLVARGVQGLGGAAGMVGAFPLLRGGEPEGRRWWVAAAVLATAAGPALGGVLTEAFDWRAIFFAQAPVAAAAALIALRGRDAQPDLRAGRFQARPAIGLALVSASLTAVVFLLVLQLVAGFATDPLGAAALVTITPAAALLGARIGGDHRARAAAGAALVGGGTLALAFLPGDRLAYTALPQVLAGFGMGLALTALAGPLLPERTAGDAARLLALRHLGISAVILALAIPLADDYDRAVERAQLQGIAVILDSPESVEAKLDLAPKLLDAVNTDRPRAGLRELPESPIVDRVDEIIVLAVSDAFDRAYVIAGVLALLGALVLLPLGAPPKAFAALAAALIAAALVTGVYARQRDRLEPEPVRLADPCRQPAPAVGFAELARLGAAVASGGIDAAYREGLPYLNRIACRFGSSREELVLAFFDDTARRRFQERYDVDPRSPAALLGGLTG